MFNQQQQQQQQYQQQQFQQQQLLQLQQLLQQAPQQAPLPMAVSRGLPQQQPQQQLLGLQGTHPASLLNGSMLQRALLLQQLQGTLRGYNMATPNLMAPSLTPPQLATPNLQQFFPQATRQSLLGPPPIGVPINPSQLSLSGRIPQKQSRAPTSTPPNRKTVPEDSSDPSEGSVEATESQMETAKDQDAAPCPDGIASERHPQAPESETCKVTEPPAKKMKSSEETTEKWPLEQPQQPQTRKTAPKQTQTPELLPEPLEARGMPRFQPRVLQTRAQEQPQTQPPVDTQVQPKLQKQAQTQTCPEPSAQQQGQPQACPQPPEQVQLQRQAQTQTCPQVHTQPPEQPQPQGCVPAPEQALVPGHAMGPERPPNTVEARGGTEATSLEPVGASAGASQEEPASGLDVGDCEKRAREMLGMWGAGGSLKVTILQSSNSRAFSTVSLAPVSRPGDSSSANPAVPSPPSKQALQFFCYICKASCSSQQQTKKQIEPTLLGGLGIQRLDIEVLNPGQEFQDHLSEAQHQQRLGEIQHMSQACLLSLLPVPRDVLEREEEEPPPRRWCNTCQVYYVGDLIQHRRTQDHKIAKQSLRPFCTICNRYFKTPRKFVEHVKSQGHKDKAKELKMLEKEIAGQDEDHFITVDAVGCFEGDEEEEDEDEDEEEIEVDEEFCKQVRSRDISIEEWKGSETYSPNTACGVDFLVPVMGYVCRVCHKFYHSNSGAQLSHCKTLAHFENLQKYKATKNPSPTTRPVSRRCAINARNALTALFTSTGGSGRPPSQPSSQDTAKIPNKVTARPPNRPPAPRRSSRRKT